MASEFIDFVFLGIFYGFSLAVAFNSTLLFIAKRNLTNLAFVLYVIFSSLYIACTDKFGYYLSIYQVIDNIVLYQAFFVMLTNIFLTWYVQRMMKVEQLIPAFKTIYVIFIVIRVLVFLIEISGFISFRISAFLDLAVIIFAYVIGIKKLTEGYPPAKPFLLGFTIFFIGLVLFETKEIFLEDFVDQALINASLHFGFFIQMITQSRAIAAKYKLLEKDKEIKELELKKKSSIEDSWIMLMDILDYVPHQIFLKDQNHKIVLANKRTADVLGRTREDILGKSDADFFAFNVAEDYLNDELEMLKSGKGRIIPEFEFHGKDGTERIFNSMKVPFYIKDLNQTGLLGIEVEITEFKKIERELKDKNEEILSQKEENEFQKIKISELYEEVQDSIKTAKKIQEAIMPPEKVLAEYFHEYFVLYLPKDIVSGDFYWFKHLKSEDKLMFATVDCTGHGVAGAFISLIAHNILNKISESRIYKTPAAILDRLNNEMMLALNQGPDSEHGSHDGMDITLCIYDQVKQELEFAGACQQLVLVRNNEMELYKLDYFSIGYLNNNKHRNYTNHKIELLEGDQIYLYSDGFAGQFGGEGGQKKFMYNRLRDTLLENSHLSMKDQRVALNASFIGWKGEGDQTDDVMVMGFKF